MTHLYQSHYVNCPWREDEKDTVCIMSINWCSSECQFYKSHNNHSLECVYPEKQRRGNV